MASCSPLYLCDIIILLHKYYSLFDFTSETCIMKKSVPRNSVVSVVTGRHLVWESRLQFSCARGDLLKAFKMPWTWCMRFL